MANWTDGGAMPPRAGYYAERAEEALARDASPGAGGLSSQRQRERAAVFAALEGAAATERLTMELANLDARR